ncbi:Aminopeptidase N [Toxocara canis]|uniref:Aminopeptidase N n=1 Tax=Toxocara canis TaxID=6265 RepID=A0A0B2V4Q4_TOXCA|nr:Aminopeptidase N [Toxocara canis]
MFHKLFVIVCALTVGCLCIYDEQRVRNHASSSFFKTPSAEGRIKEKQLLVNKAMPEKDKRVPNVLEPKEYYIRIQPYFPYSGVELPPGRNLTFDGVTTFIFTVNRPTSTFTLHALNLEFNEVTLTDANGNRLGTPSVTVNASYEHVIVHPQQTPTVGSTYILQFKYIGLINSYTLGGLFHTYYLDAHGREHWIIATHMQTGVQTRAMFPCLDEPAYKAIFHVTVVYPKGLVALSNMMERQYVELGDGWVFIRYPQTPKMSSYLVAFAVGPFVSKSVVNDAGTLIRVWGWEGQEGYLDFALNVSSKCHYSMGEFLDFPYPLSKSDQLGIPEFPAGAMENFGLLIYKYQYIAINPQVHSTDVKQQASAVICHEVAHQWFGDIVTASWWSELVINEGFAHYFQIYIQAKAFRQQSRFLDGKFLIESMQKGLDTDAEVYSSHPIISPERNFDNIVYDKGSSVLRMVKFVLGDDAWQDGLRDFIHTYQYSVADHEMLFAKLTTAAQKHNLIDWCGRPFDASKFLRPWFLQQCFPLVTITNNQLTADSVITQTAFSDITLLPSSNFTYSWPVPLYVSNYVNNTSTLKWIKPSYDNCEIGTVRTKPLRNNELSSPQQSTLSNERAVHWELGNSKMGAFVRVAYDDIGYARLLEDLKTHRSKHFSMADKIAILGDEIDFVRQKEFAGVPFSFRRLIELMTIILPNYPYFGAFKLCQPIIDQLELLFVDGLDYGLFQRFVSALLLDNYQKLGWTPTGDWDNDMARFTMLPYVARYGVGDSASEALKLFDTFVNDCKSTTTGVNNCSRVPPDVRQAVYCAAIKNGPRANFEFLLKLYRHQVANDPYFYQEYHAMLAGMACTQSVQDMNTLIPELLRANQPELSYAPLMYLTKNPLASDVMVDYLRNHAMDVFASYRFTDFLVAMTTTWQTPARVVQYDKLGEYLSETYPSLPMGLFHVHRMSLRGQVAWSMSYFPDIAHIFYDKFVKKGDEPWEQRLPIDLMPLKYNAFIQPYFVSSSEYEWPKNMTFDSIVNITINVVKSTSVFNISVHRLLITPADVILKDDVGGLIGYSKLVKDYENGVMTIYMNSTLRPGSTFSLQIKSVGFIFDGPSEGVYTNFNYFEFNGKTAWILSTDMEAGPGLRSLVPCFDEPYFKAKWQISIKHPADMIALSNTIHTSSIADRSDDNVGWATTSFSETPLMSSYLVALAVGHFASLEKVSETGVLVRVWAWTGMERYAEMGLNLAAGSIDYMARFLDMPSILPKIDLVTLPQYTGGAGAMENWGMICASYKAVLIDPLYATALDYSYVARVTPHEVVHQWFGDLITADWWSLIFLNEAFAQYYYSDAANYTYPQQYKYAKFVRFWLADYALTKDGQITETRPIITVRKPIFTYAPYYKGASVLYMLNNAIGVPVMQEGLRIYFKENAKKTTTETVLWEAITRAAASHGLIGWDNEALNVQNLMDPWTKQENFPVLKLTTSSGIVTYTQEPFIRNLSALAPSDYGYKWTIPVHSQTSSGEVFRYFTASDSWTRALGSSWQIENPGSVGCYRVWYDEDTWAPIHVQLNRDHTVIDELTRAQFISDAFELRKRGSLPWSRVLQFVTYLSKEEEYAPHVAFQRVRDQLLRAFKGTADISVIQKFIQRSFDTAYRNVGWANNTDWSMAALATLATDGMCRTGHAACLADTKALFSDFLTNCEYSTTGTGLCNSDVRPDVRRTQYCYGLAQLPKGFELVKKLYDWFTENSYYFSRDTDNLLNALACTKERALINDLIASAVAGKYPDTILSYIALHDDTDHILWQYFVEHTADVVYGVPSFTTYLTAAISTWNRAERIDEINKFLGTSNAELLSNDDWQVVQNLKTEIEQNIDWLAANRDEIILSIITF